MSFERREPEPSTAEHSVGVIMVFFIFTLGLLLLLLYGLGWRGVRFVGIGCRWIG